MTATRQGRRNSSMGAKSQVPPPEHPLQTAQKRKEGAETEFSLQVSGATYWQESLAQQLTGLEQGREARLLESSLASALLLRMGLPETWVEWAGVR